VWVPFSYSFSFHIPSGDSIFFAPLSLPIPIFPTDLAAEAFLLTLPDRSSLYEREMLPPPALADRRYR
jgi:hypothetical protein